MTVDSHLPIALDKPAKPLYIKVKGLVAMVPAHKVTPLQHISLIYTEVYIDMESY